MNKQQYDHHNTLESMKYEYSELKNKKLKTKLFFLVYFLILKIKNRLELLLEAYLSLIFCFFFSMNKCFSVKGN